MMKCNILFLIILLLWACRNSIAKHNNKFNSTELIGDPVKQNIIFDNLMGLTNKEALQNQMNDSLAFLVLPVKLSCPACRKKAIDSIVKHHDNLLDHHFIIISGSEGRKNMNSYFQEVDKEMPVMKNQLFLDTTNQAYKMELVSENPVIYYTANQKVYKKVSAIPATVKDDLREFFSGILNADHSE